MAGRSAPTGFYALARTPRPWETVDTEPPRSEASRSETGHNEPELAEATDSAGQCAEFTLPPNTGTRNGYNITVILPSTSASLASSPSYGLTTATVPAPVAATQTSAEPMTLTLPPLKNPHDRYSVKLDLKSDLKSPLAVFSVGIRRGENTAESGGEMEIEDEEGGDKDGQDSGPPRGARKQRTQRHPTSPMPDHEMDTSVDLSEVKTEKQVVVKEEPDE